MVHGGKRDTLMPRKLSRTPSGGSPPGDGRASSILLKVGILLSLCLVIDLIVVPGHAAGLPAHKRLAETGQVCGLLLLVTQVAAVLAERHIAGSKGRSAPRTSRPLCGRLRCRKTDRTGRSAG